VWFARRVPAAEAWKSKPELRNGDFDVLDFYFAAGGNPEADSAGVGFYRKLVGHPVD